MLTQLSVIALTLICLQPMPPDMSRTITIEVLSGKSGKPISNEHLVLFAQQLDETDNAHLVVINLKTNAAGIATLAVEDTSLREFSVLVDDFHAICQSKSPHYSAAEILASGFSVKNTCGKIKRDPVPGRLVLFTRPYTFWEKMAT